MQDPLVASPGLQPDILNFVAKFSAPAVNGVLFKLGVGGRDILAMNNFSLLTKVEGDSLYTRQNVRLVICTDIVFLAQCLAGSFVLLSPPVERPKVKLFDAQREQDPTFKISMGSKHSFLLEAESVKAKEEWVEIICNHEYFTPTALLSGPAVLSTSRKQLPDVLSILQIVDYRENAGMDALKDEWKTIPPVCRSYVDP